MRSVAAVVLDFTAPTTADQTLRQYIDRPDKKRLGHATTDYGNSLMSTDDADPMRYCIQQRVLLYGFAACGVKSQN
jgi:hypothetical protein